MVDQGVTFLEDVIAENRYRNQKERDRRLNAIIDRQDKLKSGCLPSLIYEYQPPPCVESHESYSLYHFMITGIPTQTHYLNPRHKWLHIAIERLHEDQSGYATSYANNMSTTKLLNYLHEVGWIKRAGGEGYVKKLFKEFDVQDIIYRRGCEEYE